MRDQRVIFDSLDYLELGLIRAPPGKLSKRIPTFFTSTSTDPITFTTTTTTITTGQIKVPFH
jgi:hypothetical protein